MHWPVGFDLFHPKRWAEYYFGRRSFKLNGGVFWFKKQDQADKFLTEWTAEKIAAKASEKVDPRRSDIFRG